MNISTPALAADVHRFINTAYYAALLDALQIEAARFDYRFEKTSATPMLPAAFLDCLARAVAARRRIHLYAPVSDAASDVDDFDMADGFAQRLVETLLAALREQGIALLPGPSTSSLLAAEPATSREITIGKPALQGSLAAASPSAVAPAAADRPAAR
jgi:hypothetical protein